MRLSCCDSGKRDLNNSTMFKNYPCKYRTERSRDVISEIPSILEHKFLFGNGWVMRGFCNMSNMEGDDV
jgi:hypothetical protein